MRQPIHRKRRELKGESRFGGTNNRNKYPDKRAASVRSGDVSKDNEEAVF